VKGGNVVWEKGLLLRVGRGGLNKEGKDTRFETGTRWKQAEAGFTGGLHGQRTKCHRVVWAGESQKKKQERGGRVQDPSKGPKAPSKKQGLTVVAMLSAAGLQKTPANRRTQPRLEGLTKDRPGEGRKMG